MIKRTKTNFTLIELLVVMLLMGFLITLMLPGFNRMISGNKVDQMASNLKLALEQAQSHAITSRRYVALVLPSNKKSWTDTSGNFVEEKRHCFGGYRMAYVKSTGLKEVWEFVKWVPDSVWKNAPDGAMLVEVVGSNDSKYDELAEVQEKGLAGTVTKTNEELGKNELVKLRKYPKTETTTITTPTGSAVVFSPYGGVKLDEDLRFVVAEAIPNGKELLFPSRGSDGPTNYLVLDLNRITGKVDYLSIQ